MRDISYRVALGGIVSALCLVTMFLAGIMPALYLVLPLIAGVLLMIIAEEVSKGWAALTYISVGILSLFITADKEAALIFIMMFGHYPILRFYLDRISLSLFRGIVKLAVFNACTLAYFYVTVYIFGLSEVLEDMDEFGRYGGAIMLAACNLIFILYDYNLRSFHKIYVKRIMPKFRRMK